VLWVEQGQLYIDTIHESEPYTFSAKGLQNLNIQELEIMSDPQTEFSGVNKFIAISDIHGQFGLFKSFLTSHTIVDEKGDWVFGENHLVIVGDVLDRGEHAVDALWYIYKLEQQAREAGGQLHFLLGNHEMMVINDDLRYLHKKYNYTSGISQRKYSTFFGPNTFFGRWLSSKKVGLSVNDIFFVHGGISEDVTNLHKPIGEINDLFRDKILFHSKESILADSIITLLAKSKGPLWYRGYAYPSTFNMKKAKLILKELGKKSVVVGHTSMEKIRGLYDNRIILIDSSIKNGKSGEVLIWEGETLFAGDKDGAVRPLISEDNNPEPESLYSVLHRDPSPRFTIETSMKTVYKNEDEVYEDGVLTYAPYSLPLTFSVGVRTSGLTRRRICSRPPLKINFKKKELKSFGFTDSDKFKILMPCKYGSRYETYIKKEHLIYELYNIVEPTSLKSKLVTITIDDVKKDPKEYTALVVEHKEHFTARTGAKILEEGVIRKQSIDPEQYLTFCLFQFLIANPDYQLMTRHNLMVIKKAGHNRLFMVPFDFDSSGFINAEYAGPPEVLPIKMITERYFMDKSCTMVEMRPIIDTMLAKKEAMIDHCKNVDYLDAKSKQQVIKFLEKSFDMISDEKKARKKLGIKEE
jgi:hypothetical protein